MDDDGGAIGVMVSDVGVNSGVEEVRELRCMWYFLETKDVGLIVHVKEYGANQCKNNVMEYDCLTFVDVFCSIMDGKC